MLEALDRPRAQSLPLQRPGRLDGARGWLVRLHAQHPVLAPLAAFAVLGPLEGDEDARIAARVQRAGNFAPQETRTARN